MKDLIPKHYLHQLVHSFSVSEINDGAHSAVSNAKFCRNVLIYFPYDEVFQPHVLLMKETSEKYFKQTPDNGIENRSNSILITPEGDSEYGVCVAQTMLEHNLHARHVIKKN